MQKLWRRTPPPFFSLSLSSLPLSSTSMPALSTKTHLKTPLVPSRRSFFCVKTLNPLPPSSFTQDPNPGRGACRFYTCCASRVSRPPTRAWVVHKRESCDAASAWVHETAGEGSGGGVEDGEKAGRKVRSGGGRRRIRGSSPDSAAAAVESVQSSPDLLTIPGVGPRNLRKLVENGIGGVEELKQLYRDKFSGQASQKMVEFLQSSVGIIHKSHAKSITSFIKESVDEELKEEPATSLKKSGRNRLTFCVEGNISVGKTTFLQRIANETVELRDFVEVVPEPISKWQDIGPEHFNILDAFYAEPERYAYTFQNYVFVTRVMQEKESAAGIKPLRLMERSVFSDRMVFVRAVHEAKWMNEMEISIYDSWFDPVVSTLPGLIPDGFIYLRASPDTCHKRMKMRKRTEEGGVSLDYLRDLHEKHESWLFPLQTGNHGVLSVSKPKLHIDDSLHPEIKDRVFYLEGNHMHASIQKVPALVLDCEPDIDFNRDIEAKEQYARQVAKFFEFVKKKKEAVPPKDGDGRKNSEEIVFPRQGGLWVPDHNRLSAAPFNPMDFSKALSFVPT